MNALKIVAYFKDKKTSGDDSEGEGRSKRDAQTDEINDRLDALLARQDRIQSLLTQSKKVAASIKTSVSSAREELSR